MICITQKDNDKAFVFMPLNISYSTKKSSDKKLLWLLICSAVLIVMLALFFKIRSDFFFSDIVGSTPFLVIGLIIIINFYIFLVRKLVLKENREMRLYEESVEHELTTINNLWEIFSTKDDIYSYHNGTHKIFLKCEKGFVISRPEDHESLHRDAYKMFMRQILNRGYGIEYYDYHVNDANTEPLEKLSSSIKRVKNPELYKCGAELLKVYRQLDNICYTSKVDYFVITAYNIDDASFLKSTVENAIPLLEGSLYADVRICDSEDVIEFLELKEKVSGVNFTDLMNLSLRDLDQVVVTPVDVIRYNQVKDENITVEPKSVDELESELKSYMEELYESVKKVPTRRSENLLKPKYSEVKPVNMSDSEIEDELNKNKVLDRRAREESIDNTPIPIEDYTEDEYIAEGYGAYGDAEDNLKSKVKFNIKNLIKDNINPTTENYNTSDSIDSSNDKLSNDVPNVEENTIKSNVDMNNIEDEFMAYFNNIVSVPNDNINADDANDEDSKVTSDTEPITRTLENPSNVDTKMFEDMEQSFLDYMKNI